MFLYPPALSVCLIHCYIYIDVVSSEGACVWNPGDFLCKNPQFANNENPQFANKEDPTFANEENPQFENEENPQFTNEKNPQFANKARPSSSGFCVSCDDMKLSSGIFGQW